MALESDAEPWDMLRFLRETPVPQADLDFFSSRESTKGFVTSPHYIAAPFYSRYKKTNSPTSDLYFAQTTFSPSTIPNCLLLVRREDDSPDGGISALSEEDLKNTRPFRAPAVPDLQLLFHLQSGMNGFADTGHGGAMCALLDETLGMCVEVYRQRNMANQKTRLYTAQLNVTFLSPVRTPGIIVVRAWMLKREGRKWTCRAQIVGVEGQDDVGKVLLETDSLWISVKEEGSL